MERMHRPVEIVKSAILDRSKSENDGGLSSGSPIHVPFRALCKVAFTFTPATRPRRGGLGTPERKKPLSGSGFGVQQLESRCSQQDFA